MDILSGGEMFSDDFTIETPDTWDKGIFTIKSKMIIKDEYGSDE